MNVLASSYYSLEPDSEEVGRAAARSLREGFSGEPLAAMLVYCTIDHDQSAVLKAARAELGPGVPILGCSVQGVASDRGLAEDGFVVGAMGLGGSALRCAIAVEHDVEKSTWEKGQQIGKKLKGDLGNEPKVVIVLYDPLCGADVETLLSGMAKELSCPFIGGGAGQPFGAPIRTYQYWDCDVFSHGVIALALDGPFATQIGLCHGTSATGLARTVTKSQANRIQEINGRSALDTWREITGHAKDEIVTQEHMATWAVGLERTFTENDVPKAARMIRGAFGFDEEGAVILQSAVPEGASVTFHHRTAEDVLSGTRAMAEDLKKRAGGQQPWAVLGFECAARTTPFLGLANTNQEHQELRAAIAPGAPWMGMMAWGEIAPLGGAPAFHNYTYPLVMLTAVE
jgi:hypothetical protein